MKKANSLRSKRDKVRDKQGRPKPQGLNNTQLGYDPNDCVFTYLEPRQGPNDPVFVDLPEDCNGLEAVEVFMELGRLGSMWRVARKLGIGRRRVATYIAFLEQEQVTGGRLFHRFLWRYSLTPRGQGYFDHIIGIRNGTIKPYKGTMVRE